MTYVYYRSTSDGWRIGTADNFNNVSTVTVADVLTGLVEHVTPSDVFVPANCKRTREDGSEEIIESPLLHPEIHPGEYLEKDDVTVMRPSPTELPPLVGVLRHRFAQKKDLTFLGDSFALFMRRSGLSPNRSQTPSPSAGDGLATRAVAALRASSTNKSQLIACFGNGTFSLCSALAQDSATQLGASEEDIRKLQAAHTILQVFTHGINGEQKVLRRVTVFANRAESSGEEEEGEEEEEKEEGEEGQKKTKKEWTFSHSAFNYSLFDTEHVVNTPESNFLALAFPIYGFNSEEKERCYIPRGSTRHFSAVEEISDPEVLAMIRERYFAWSKAMEVIGFEVNVLLTISARIAAVLHLLNIDFDEEGAPISMNGIKYAARLLQLDFNEFQQVLVNKETCEVAAKVLYYATFLYLVQKVNELLNPKGVSQSPAQIAVLGLPQVCTPGCVAGLRSLVINTLYEDTFQAFYRASDQEILQWQQQGFKAPPETNMVFEQLDNYSVLKALKAKGGALSIVLDHLNGTASETTHAALKKLGHYKNCSFNEDSYTLTIKHSFGSVEYAMPRDEEDLKALRSIFHQDFEPIRLHLLQYTDVETQEALCHIEQEEEELKTPFIVTQLWTEMTKNFFSVISSQDHFTWWGSVIAAENSKFKGIEVAQQLSSMLGSAALELRRFLPNRYIPVDYAFVSERYGALLPRTYITHPDVETNNRFRAEAICVAAKIPHVVGKTSLLLQASSIAELAATQLARFSKTATMIQASLRCFASSAVVLRRVSRWTEAVSTLEDHQQEIEALYQWRAENAERHHLQHLVLQEEEQRGRASIRDEYWVEWVALETERQNQLEGLIQTAIATAVEAENTMAMRAIEDSHRKAVVQVHHRVKERMLRQGARLDHVARMELTKGKGKYQVEKMEEAHDRIVRMQVAQEEAKMELETRLRQKGQRYKHVLAGREEKRAELRDKLWMRLEKERAVKSHMDANREQMAMHMKQTYEMDEIERKLAARLQAEVRDRQRAEKEAETMRLKQLRDEKVGKIEAQRRANTLKQLKAEKKETEVSVFDVARKRKEGAKVLTSQNREREALERARAEDLKRQKVLTRTLLKAHNAMMDPAIYEQTTKGSVLREGSHGGKVTHGTSEGLIMAGGKSTHPQLLDESTWKGLSKYHTGPSASTSIASPSSSKKRPTNRSASPRSIISL